MWKCEIALRVWYADASSIERKLTVTMDKGLEISLEQDSEGLHSKLSVTYGDSLSSSQVEG